MLLKKLEGAKMLMKKLEKTEMLIKNEKIKKLPSTGSPEPMFLVQCWFLILMIIFRCLCLPPSASLLSIMTWASGSG